MEAITEQCLDDGICAGQAAFGRDASLLEEFKSAMADWESGFSPAPTDEMLAAWLIGYSGVLAQHYELLIKAQNGGGT